MGWHVSDDIEFYDQASAFQAHVGARWWVIWCPGRRCYTGFYCGPADITPIDVNPDSGRDFLLELRYAESRASWPPPSSHPRRREGTSRRRP